MKIENGIIRFYYLYAHNNSIDIIDNIKYNITNDVNAVSKWYFDNMIRNRPTISWMEKHYSRILSIETLQLFRLHNKQIPAQFIELFQVYGMTNVTDFHPDYPNRLNDLLVLNPDFSINGDFNWD
jgi:hypothetical protein